MSEENKNEECSSCGDNTYPIITPVHNRDGPCQSPNGVCLSCWVENYYSNNFVCPCNIRCSKWLRRFINENEQYRNEIDLLIEERNQLDRNTDHPLREILYIIADNTGMEYIKEEHSSNFEKIFSELKVIDLSNQPLTPEQLIIIKEYGNNYTELIVKNCDIESLSQFAPHFFGLVKILDIRDNPISSIENIDRLFPHLQEIDLSNTLITDLSPLSRSNLKLKFITAKNCNIQISDTPNKFVFVRYVDIRFNEQFDINEMDFNELFPSILILKTDREPRLWINRFELTDEDKHVLTKYNREGDSVAPYWNTINEDGVFDFPLEIMKLPIFYSELQFEENDIVIFIKLVSLGFFDCLTEISLHNSGITQEHLNYMIRNNYNCDWLYSIVLVGGNLIDINNINVVFPEVYTMLITNQAIERFPDLSAIQSLRLLDLSDNNIVMNESDIVHLYNSEMIIYLNNNQIRSIVPFYNYLPRILLDIGKNPIENLLSDLNMDQNNITDADIEKLFHIRNIPKNDNNLIVRRIVSNNKERIMVKRHKFQLKIDRYILFVIELANAMRIIK